MDPTTFAAILIFGTVVVAAILGGLVLGGLWFVEWLHRQFSWYYEHTMRRLDRRLEEQLRAQQRWLDRRLDRHSQQPQSVRPVPLSGEVRMIEAAGGELDDEGRRIWDSVGSVRLEPADGD